MRPPNDTREAPASCRDLLGAAGCLSIAGPISTALVASTNPIQLAAAPSHSTAQTGIDIRGLTQEHGRSIPFSVITRIKIPLRHKSLGLQQGRSITS
jgi:hypothetical protein